MPKYLTKQRKTLLVFLSQHVDEALSAQQISAALTEEGISLSAVYRNLADLEQEGKVCRYNKDGSREVYFRYIDTDSCRDMLHLSCTKCGKTYHMDTEDADILISRIAQSEKFAINKKDTVLYGICEACQNK